MSEAVATDWIRWIPALPLLSAAIHALAIGLLRTPLRVAAATALSCTALGLSFAASFALLLELVASTRPEPALMDDVFTWIGAGRLQIEATLLFDPLAAVVCLLATGIAFFVTLHASATLPADPREEASFQRLLCFLDLATTSLLLLVLAENLAVFFLGWQLLGVCAHLLIGYWYLDARAARGATRVLGVQLIADVALLGTLLLLAWASSETGSPKLGFRGLSASAPALQEQTLGTPMLWSALPGMAALGAQWSVSNLSCIGFVVAAACRAAQVPFQFFARDTARAPAPALAVLLTTSGLPAALILLCRVDPLLGAATGVLPWVAWMGVATALLASLAALVQREARRNLVYVGLVQVSLGFVAIGLGAPSAALFHLVTQAACIAVLFLCLATVSRALGLAPHQDLDPTAGGALWRSLPRTHAVFVCGWAAAVGIPFTAGFFSRDQLFLVMALSELPGRAVLQATALAAQAVTAFSITRLWLTLFHGPARHADATRLAAGEGGLGALSPLFVLGFLALFIGWLGPSGALNPFPVADAESNSLANFVTSVLPPFLYDVSHGTERRLAFLLAGVSGAAALLAWRVPDLGSLGLAERLRALRVRLFPPLRRAARALFETPQLIRRAVRPTLRQADRVLLRGVESRVASRRVLTGSSRVVGRSIQHSLRPLQSGQAQGYLLLMLVGTLALLVWLRP